jgi:LDH2 family malate/lactate/ureidoglycolate dehydrogenase
MRFEVPDELAVRVAADDMRATVASIFGALGMPEDDAEQAADALVWADLRGIDSHGVSNMMPTYVEGLRSGTINPKPVRRIVREAPAVATLDSDAGLGLAIGPRAMELALSKAEACGVGAVAVTRGRHFGAAGYHASLALPRRMIGVAMTMGGQQMLPTFGAAPRVGLNAIAIAAPTRDEAPFLFDVSTSSVAANKLAIARRLGADVPGGWIARADGTPILEPGPVPEEPFHMLPTGGSYERGSHKGYGLGVAVDILAGILSGNPPGFARPRGDVSHHFLAYRIDAFTDVEEFERAMDAFMRGLRETPPAPGHARVLHAGLPEAETLRERSARGIPYHRDVVEWFRAAARGLGVAHRLG